ncbi:MAG: hypothetical protein MJ188_08025 [Treponema sp.]|nr:hypothetical protein [Treponema sp.]
MRIVEFKDLRREEGQIFYIRKYYCIAVLDLPTGIEYAPIKFNIEVNCIGIRTIEIHFEKQINYPLLPVKKLLIDYITKQDIEGLIPC